MIGQLDGDFVTIKNMINKWNQEIQELESQRQIINSKKRELWKKIANLKNKINIYKNRKNDKIQNL